ncbi:6-pyruvoyl trahydropterin synthase family protein [Akkermansia massiliensis]
MPEITAARKEKPPTSGRIRDEPRSARRKPDRRQTLIGIAPRAFPRYPAFMAYRICKSIELESGHLLSKHPGNCKFPHGHTRSVEMVFRADTLDSNDMVVDFKAVKQMMGDFLQQFDHSLCVNTEDPNYAAFVAAYGERIIPFDREDPTSEVMARTIFNFARHALEKAREGSGEYPVRDCVTLERVRVWETSSSWAEYGE